MNITESASAWSVIWNCIINFFTSFKELLDDITLFSIGGAFHCSLWDFCLGIIIMSAIIGQFIIFAQPVLPDQPTSSWREDRANKRYTRSQISKRRGG